LSLLLVAKATSLAIYSKS